MDNNNNKKFEINSVVENAVIKKEVTKENAIKSLRLEEQRKSIQIKEQIAEKEGKDIYLRSIKDIQGRGYPKEYDLDRLSIPVPQLNNEKNRSVQKKRQEFLLNLDNNAAEKEKVEFLDFYYSTFVISVDKESNKDKFYKELDETLMMHSNNYETFWGRMKNMKYLWSKGLKKRTIVENLTDKIKFLKFFLDDKGKLFKLVTYFTLFMSITSMFIINEYNKIFGMLFDGHILGVVSFSLFSLLPVIFILELWNMERYSNYHLSMRKHIESLKEKYKIEDDGINFVEYMYHVEKTNDKLKNELLMQNIYKAYVNLKDSSSIYNKNRSLELIKNAYKSVDELLEINVSKIKNELR